MKMCNNQKGITLITLVVTIIVLIILTGVTIGAIAGHNGLIDKSKHASDNFNTTIFDEQSRLNALLEDMYSEQEIRELIITITYIGNGGKTASNETEVIEFASNTIATNMFIPVNARRFVKWNTMQDGTGTDYSENAPITFTENLTLYAIWEDLHTVSYNANGGSGTMASETGASLTVKANTFTAPSGKVFEKWNTQANGGGTDYAVGATITSDTTLYAIWRNPNITYHPGQGSGTMASTATTVANCTFTPPAQVSGQSRKVFDKWRTNPDGTGDNYNPGATVTQDIDLYATWRYPVVSYNANGGSGTMTQSTGSSITIKSNTFTAPSGKTFKEWRTASNGTGTLYTANTTATFTADTTLFAIWQNVYTVSYNANGGSGTMASHTGLSVTIKSNTFTAPSGKAFKEWNTNSSGTGTKYTAGTSVSQNLTLYAIWGETIASKKGGSILSNSAITTLIDDNGKEVKIPAKFKIASDSATVVANGIVIEDGSGNQFVWIPVDNISSYTRTAFQGKNITSTFTEAMPSDEQTSVTNNKGYYIGRYEAGDSTKPTASGNSLRASGASQTNAVCIKKGYAPYNRITRTNAKTRAEAMKTEQGYQATTKLCSSYAWDTAIKFIENTVSNYGSSSPQGNYKDVDKNYTDITGTSQSVASGTSANVIPTGQTTPVCNIYDMGGNVYEWTSESYSNSSYPCTLRGGCFYYNYGSYPAGNRDYCNDAAGDNVGFRVTLFL